ncbi:hypothetical protein R8Z57_06645 [Microbacterium sp. M3]|uniref:Uncharacterized protein n=1 Tax=Microbacterium arthrosphaerae TaxID=792652 RepID=A0ABU4GZG7_9MICO|nr:MULTISPECIES: hypothetical protein [Microbacterium]MDW4572458.1 hypothetical protein [Microbacterium arthrosphaerae]MDW7606313.1 hypothetical protein [Microbacterium sp. M3]
MTQRRSRRRLLSWIPISIVALICVGFVVAALLMQNSWWIDDDRPASADQQASDGMSMLTDPGVDYLTRKGILRVRVGEDALPAAELGLEADGSRTFEPLTPVQAVVIADDGAFYVDLVRSFTVTTAGGRVESVALVRETNGDWLSMLPVLQDAAESWGWTDEDLARLEEDLTSAAHEGDGKQYSAQLGPVEHNGALSSATVDVDLDSSEVTVSFVVADAGAGS